jgi:large subunit ribosomal protein L17
MRHGKKFNHLGRKKGHRDSLLMNLAQALIQHKRINTTLAKAKALRSFVEPILTKSKENTTHSRRIVFSDLQNKDSVKELFDVIAEKIMDRPGGYCRIIKTGFRQGDGAETAMIELVDFNTVLTAKTGSKAAGTRRGRRKSSGTSSAAPAAAGVAAAAAAAAVAPETESPADEVVSTNEEE